MIHLYTYNKTHKLIDREKILHKLILKNWRLNRINKKFQQTSIQKKNYDNLIKKKVYWHLVIVQ